METDIAGETETEWCSPIKHTSPRFL